VKSRFAAHWPVGAPFVLGHGRSGTTLLAQLVNAHPRALVTAEANFHLRRPGDGFREIFNSQHRSWNNQISKLSYVPNLDGRAGGEWWQWLEQTALHYDRLGDKMAFGPAHFDVISPEQWMAFYEQRFLCSKYLFVFREPKQTILSCRRTFSYSASAISYLQSWVCFVALRAGVIRIFPNVIAQFLDELDETRLAGISTFLGVDLCPAAPLLNPSEQRYHSAHDVEAAEIFDIYGDRLSEIWSNVCATAHLSPALLQADRKRTRDHNETARLGPEIPSGFISVVSTPVGRAWVAANEIMAEIASK
jgi:hypothetical protein